MSDSDTDSNSSSDTESEDFAYCKVTVTDCCDKLKAEPLHTNDELWNFNVVSRDVDWREYVKPLAKRDAQPVHLGREFDLMSKEYTNYNAVTRPELLVCHDMMGNYRTDVHFHTSKKYDDYRFFHWSAIDYFNYFSHHYITIPPCNWINCAHAHGVKVLGTFIVEHHKGVRLLHQVLRNKDTIDKTVKSLIKLCKHFRFEGWLINIEHAIGHENVENLYYFLENLRTAIEREVENGVIIWYDSIIEDGSLHWQNELNNKNQRFFRCSTGTLINYAWDDNSFDNTNAVIDHFGMQRNRAFFGIDIFGRTQEAKFHTRVTLKRVLMRRFSVGLFATGWTFESLTNFGYDITEPTGRDDVNEAFVQRNDKWWHTLWDLLPIFPYSQLPFYSDFCLGSGKNTYTFGKCANYDEQFPQTHFFNLSRQSLQPSVPLYKNAERYFNHAFNGGSCLRITTIKPFRILSTHFKLICNTLILAYAFKLDPTAGEMDIILRFVADDPNHTGYIFCGNYSADESSPNQGCSYASPLKPSVLQEHQLQLASDQIPVELVESQDAEAWRTRYYAIKFDNPVTIRDVGVVFRPSHNSLQFTGYLGAIYVNQIDMSAVDLPPASQCHYVKTTTGEGLNAKYPAKFPRPIVVKY